MSDEDLREQVAGLGLGTLEQHQVAAGSFEGLVSLDVWASLPKEAKVGVGVAAAGDDVVMVILVGR